MVDYVAKCTLFLFRTDKAFVSVDAIDADGNMSVGNLVSISVKQAMIRISKEVIIPAYSSKLGRVSLTLIENIFRVNPPYHRRARRPRTFKVIS